MVHSALISIILGVLIVAVWYGIFLHSNRLRVQRVLRWLEIAVLTQGEISAVERLSSSHFRARLRLQGCGFRYPFLEVRLAPREMPLKWAIWRWREKKETLIFVANLACPPRHGLEIGRTRYTGLTRRWIRNREDWPTQQVSSLFISTQAKWEPEISSRMTSVVAAKEVDYLSVSFRPYSPHFSVTFALNDVMDRAGCELTIFDSLRELAESSPTSHM
jgi:hypothetical protein